MFKGIIIFCLIFSSLCFAGYEVGNGGVSVVCKNSTGDVLSVELLDIFELRQRMGISIEDFENKNQDKINWLSRVYTESNRRGALYKYYYDNFFIESLFQTEQIGLTNDYGVVGKLPMGCTLEQLVFQTAKAHPFDSIQWPGRYTINSHLWEKMSRLNKEATILHEIIYRERINQCIQFSEQGCFPGIFSLNSEAVRKLVGHYFSNDFQHSTPAYINHLYQTVGLRRFETQGVVFVDKVPYGLTMVYDEDGVATILADDLLSQEKNSISIDSFFVNDYFDKSFVQTKYFSNIKIRVKEFEVLLPSNFKVKYELGKVVIYEGTESLDSVVIKNNITNRQKEYQQVKEIQIDKDSIATVIRYN